MGHLWRRAFLVLVVASLASCAATENAPPRSGSPAPVAATSPAASGVGGPCFVSMMRNHDGKPATERRCEPGLTCDYTNAVPDGAGRCVPSVTVPPAPTTAPASSAEPPLPEVVTPPPLPDTAAIAFAGASKDYRQWSPRAGDVGPNRQKRLDAEKALTAYYVANRTAAPSAKHVVEAAYAIATMKQAAGDAGFRGWFKSTVAAWDSYKASAPVTNGTSEAQQSPYVDYAAEADFTLLDERITAAFDTPTRHTYGPTFDDIFGEVAIDPTTKMVMWGVDGRVVFKRKGKYAINAAEVEKWDLALDAITKKYASHEWVAVAIERQGRLYDALRSGLASVVFTPSLCASIEFCRQKTKQELDGADSVMVRRYATAVALGQVFKVKGERLARALGRLGYFTDVIGDDVMERLVVSTPDPATRGRTKLTYRSRQYVQSP